MGNVPSLIERAVEKKFGLRCPPSPEEDFVPSAGSWLILPMVISSSQKIQPYMILSVQENEVENMNESSNERGTLT